jgi:hypothetical protein
MAPSDVGCGFAMTLTTWTHIQNRFVYACQLSIGPLKVCNIFCDPDAEHLREHFHYTLHALPVDKWEVLLAYHPPSVIQYLHHFFSPELSDCIFGDPVTHSPEISTQTFSNRKMLEMNPFASTVAMSATVASLSAWQFIRCAGDISASKRYLSV